MSSNTVVVTAIKQISLRKSAAPDKGDAPCTSQRRNPSRPGSRVLGHNDQRQATLPALLAFGGALVPAGQVMNPRKQLGMRQTLVPNLARSRPQCAELLAR